MSLKTIITALALSLSLTAAGAHAAPTERAGAAFPLATDAIEATAPVTVTSATSVAPREAIATMPFAYRQLVTLTAPVKGEMLGLELVPAGTTGFDAGAFQDGLHLWCYFVHDAFAAPLCVGGHPIRKNRVTEVIVTSNVPQTYTYTTQMSSIYLLPENAPYAGAPLGHDFAMTLTVQGWKADSVYVRWLSDKRVVMDKILARDPDGAVRFQVDTRTLVLQPDPQDGKRTLVTVQTAAAAN